MSSVEQKITFILSSATSQTYDDGSAFIATFEEPLRLPANCISPSLCVLESDVFNVVPNLTAASTLNISGLTGADVLISFPEGIYNLSDINDIIDRTLQTSGYDEGIVKIEADTVTGKIITVLNDTTVGQTLTVEYATATSALQSLLGQTTNVTAPTTSYFSQLGDNIAKFNLTRFLLINSDIVQSGIAINGIYNNIIGKHILSSPPGSQSVYEPIHKSFTPVPNLVGAGKTSYRVWLTDDRNQPVKMSEPWSVNIELSYSEIITTTIDRK